MKQAEYFSDILSKVEISDQKRKGTASKRLRSYDSDSEIEIDPSLLLPTGEFYINCSKFTTL